MPFIECRHIFARGRKCESPSLQGENYCYYHARFHRALETGIASAGLQVSTGHLEDADAVQIALSEVLSGIATGALDPRRAGLLLYGLQVAAANVKNTSRDRVLSSVQQLSLAEDGTPLGPSVTAFTAEDYEDECEDCDEDCDPDACDCECHEEEDDAEDTTDLLHQAEKLLGM